MWGPHSHRPSRQPTLKKHPGYFQQVCVCVFCIFDIFWILYSQGVVNVFDVRGTSGSSDSPIVSIAAHDETATTAVFSPLDGTFSLISIYSPNSAQLWSSSVFSIFKTFLSFIFFRKLTMLYSPTLLIANSENILATGSDDRSVKVWDLRSSRLPLHVIRCQGLHGSWNVILWPFFQRGSVDFPLPRDRALSLSHCKITTSASVTLRVCISPCVYVFCMNKKVGVGIYVDFMWKGVGDWRGRTLNGHLFLDTCIRRSFGNDESHSQSWP